MVLRSWQGSTATPSVSSQEAEPEPPGLLTQAEKDTYLFMVFS